MYKLFFLSLIFVCLCLVFQTSGAQESPSSLEPDLLAFSEPLYLEVMIQDCKLIAYKKKDGGSLEEICEFPIATVSKNVSLYPTGKGFVTKVELNPSWFPTANIVKHMNKKLIAQGKKPTFSKGMRIGPGDPINAMGTFKMFLSQSAPGKGSIYRIHGTNLPESIGKRASSGCIRMKNETGFPIAQNIKERLRKGQQVEVNIVMAR